MTTTHIRPSIITDHSSVLHIAKATICDGTTFIFDEKTTDQELMEYWFGPKVMLYVAESDRQIAGFYKLIHNQPGRGAHVANSSFVVAPGFQGHGIGRMIGEHAVQTARDLGFKAMQFNIVISTNEPAVKLWKSLGFQVVGTVPKAFQHSTQGYVDIFVMHRFL